MAVCWALCRCLLHTIQQPALSTFPIYLPRSPTSQRNSKNLLCTNITNVHTAIIVLAGQSFFPPLPTGFFNTSTNYCVRNTSPYDFPESKNWLGFKGTLHVRLLLLLVLCLESGFSKPSCVSVSVQRIISVWGKCTRAAILWPMYSCCCWCCCCCWWLPLM